MDIKQNLKIFNIRLERIKKYYLFLILTQTESQKSILNSTSESLLLREDIPSFKKNENIF